MKDRKDNRLNAKKNKRFVVETITTMTTVTERRIVREASEDVTGATDLLPPALPAKPGAIVAAATGQPMPPQQQQQQQQPQQPSAVGGEVYDEEKPPPIPPKESSPTQISGILKGGKLWKQDSMSQVRMHSLRWNISKRYVIAFLVFI